MPRTLRLTLTLLGALAAIYALVVTWRKNERAAGLDFYIYFVASQLPARADVDNIYAPEVQERVGEEYYERALRSGSELRIYDAKRRRRLDNVSSPFLYTTFRWVSRNYERALTQDHVLLLAAFVAGVLLLARRVGVSWAAALFLLAALLLWYRGFEADLRVGNVNSLQLFACAAMLWAPPLAAGAILGALLAFKPNLLAVALLLAFARIATREFHRLRIEIAGGAIGGAFAFVAASINFHSPRVWLQWIAAANQFWHRIPTRLERNVTPALALFEKHGTAPSYAIAFVLFAIACAAIWRGRRADDPLVVGIGILIYLLSAPVVWLHYMVLVVPVAIALLRWRVTGAIALLALAMIAEVPFERLTQVPAANVEAMLIAPALFALYVCAIVRLSQRDPAAA
ncbi:MAG: DUF2029 domain-containing protein [Acidobacteria bacterium]|nr:DUF2029 domain-containing protein [Acidobacteriota bacterium]MBV9476705.1 DUF2029 domain-containing protein [Acidobacteriota bacterium]